MGIRIIADTINKSDIVSIARDQFGDMVKAVVDIGAGIMAIGGEMHADEEAALLAQGSRQADLWGINLYPDKPADAWIEFDSMINVRPAQGNPSRDIQNPDIRRKIRDIVEKLIIP